MPLPADLHDMLALHLVPGLGPRLTKALLDRFGSAGAVLLATPEQLQEVPHIGAKLGRDLHDAMQRVDVSAELERMQRHHAQLLVLGTSPYPAALAQIPDPPHLVYMRGSWEERDSNAVAVVGSRHCSAYGRRIAERLAEGLVRSGFTVVSGLARGIDGAAHRGALKAGGRTIAVLAGGLARIYPPEHDDLAMAVEGSGALLSESAMMMDRWPACSPPATALSAACAAAWLL
jgi:DNA processing protein